MDNGQVAVQGYDDGTLPMPKGESLVRIPASLILQAAAALRAGAGA